MQNISAQSVDKIGPQHYSFPSSLTFLSKLSTVVGGSWMLDPGPFGFTAMLFALHYTAFYKKVPLLGNTKP